MVVGVHVTMSFNDCELLLVNIFSRDIFKVIYYLYVYRSKQKFGYQFLYTLILYFVEEYNYGQQWDDYKVLQYSIIKTI